MLGKTAAGLYWMFRYLERSENTARMLDAGFRIALTRSTAAEDEWVSVLASAGSHNSYIEQYDQIDAPSVINFLLREKNNPSSVMSMVETARNNARLVRTALTREVWEATNECWMTMKDLLAHPIHEKELPAVLRSIRQQSALVRGALHGTMLRNDSYDFARIGTFLERADNTARILDVKYYVLLPSAQHVGTSIDNVQWETILLSVSGRSAYHWLYEGETNPVSIANFLILDRQMPRSFAFCFTKLAETLGYLGEDYNIEHPCQLKAEAMLKNLKQKTINDIIDQGLHEFIQDFISENQKIASMIEEDFRFYG
ncbi:MAG: hypothetical protein DHS20C08_18630 [Rhodomicrobium sp.]|nr:MAG: hypothetical protein DHS20C08_18630 [Rhodomicrobium sp.]